MVRRRVMLRVEGGAGPARCSRCWRMPTLVVHITHDSFDGRGRSVLAQHRMHLCEECGQRFAKRYGLKVPEVQQHAGA